MFGIGMTEMIVILVIALVVLGPKRLPEMARTLGKSLAELRRASTELRREFNDVANDARIDPPTLARPSAPASVPPPATAASDAASAAAEAPDAEPAPGGRAGG
jgi:Tat protein translocase TatB subunit